MVSMERLLLRVIITGSLDWISVKAAWQVWENSNNFFTLEVEMVGPNQGRRPKFFMGGQVGGGKDFDGGA